MFGGGALSCLPVHRLLTVLTVLVVLLSCANIAGQQSVVSRHSAHSAASKNHRASRRKASASRKASANAQKLAAKIDALTQQGEASRAFWGIELVSLEDGHTIYEQNADKLFLPASNLKLFSTVTAMALLGPEFRTHTTVETEGSVSPNGKLTGDLVLVGRGDPNLSGRGLPYVARVKNLSDKPPGPRLPEWMEQPPLRYLDEMAAQVAERGIKSVEGDIVGDDSYFAFEPYGEGWSADDLMWEYGAPVSALTVDDNTQAITVLPGATVGAKALLRFDPNVPYYQIDNRIVTTAAAASVPRGASGGGARDVAMDRQPGSRVLALWGTIPLDDTGFTDSLAIIDPAEYAAMAFKQLLEARGVAVHGRAVARHRLLASMPPPTADSGSIGGAEAESAAQPTTSSVTSAAVSSATTSITSSMPSSATSSASPSTTPSTTPSAPSSATAPENPSRTVLATHLSGPLGEDVQLTNKVSQNLHAELALRMVGHEKGASPTLDEALKVERAFLRQIGVAPEEYSIFDGSGLSREDMVAPKAVVKLLRFADSQPWAQTFRDSLPIAGADGTLAERFKTGAAFGRVFAKTGTLTHVSSLSGYATTLAGERIAFSIMVNNHNMRGRAATAIIDKIVQAMVAAGQVSSRR